ncbi:hypothetical protein ACHAXS_000704 [Conticribra weissflogii]
MFHILRYKYITSLDISMQYYNFELDEESHELCEIITSFRKYKYKCLPMELKCAPNFTQEIMEDVLQGLDNVEVYLDDIDLFTIVWEKNLLLHDKVPS